VLVCLAVIAPVAVVVAVWLGLRLRRARARLRENEKTSERHESPPAATRPLTESQLNRPRALAQAAERAERALQIGALVRELARTNLRTSADAHALIADVDGPADGETRARIERIAADSARAYKTLQALLPEICCRALSRADTPGVDVVQAIDLALDLLHPKLARLGVSVAVAGRLSVPACAGDIRSIQSVFVQLVENAAEAVHERSDERPDSGPDPAVTIAVYPTAGELAVCVDITDTGAGLPAVTPARLFAPDFTTRGAGRGAGLAVCRHLLTRVGGLLELSSLGAGHDDDDGPGTRARVTIPVTTGKD
jgi:signal transduction histidine kinase